MLVVLVGRNDSYLAPRGGTELAAGDSLLVLAESKDLAAQQQIVAMRNGSVWQAPIRP